eukprot:CAMPEP_0196821042 /NCGR_PEP_ID=MMETSP1362-20130617/77541_1 /TAXON_ID=163516 /ORGANISM="Leptocylindrus danicus, Strain CCMP1856" /LENGTH=1396 /DNA_ID=CAMNT_0042200105 /DNA_START=339 /DNA_END=4526 /DNA_ORIENTATION=-
MTSANYETFKTEESLGSTKEQMVDSMDRRTGLAPMLSRIWSEGNISSRSIANNEIVPPTPMTAPPKTQQKKSKCPCFGGTNPSDHDDADQHTKNIAGNVVPSANIEDELIMRESSASILSSQRLQLQALHRNNGMDSTRNSKSSISIAIGILEEDIHPSTPMYIHEKQTDSHKSRKWMGQLHHHMRTSYTNPKIAVTAVAGFLNYHLNLRPSEVRQFGDPSTHTPSAHADNYSIKSGSESQTGTNTSEQQQQGTDHNFTTPLHEACRMGSGKLVKTFLMRGGDPNVRDGMRRTALHCTCGGLNSKDEQYLAKAHYGMLQSENNHQHWNSTNIKQKARVPAAVGIRNDDAQRVAEEEEERFNAANNNGNKGRMKKMPAWASRMNLVSSRHLVPGDADHEDAQKMIEISELEDLESKSRGKDRMECILTLLSWDDRMAQSSSGCENHSHSNISLSAISTSINAVDARGRTALHYAAELGRENLCAALLSNRNAILTVIDDGGMTPCELAAANSHDELAARLEARAVLLGDDDGGDVWSASALLGVEDEEGGAMGMLPSTLSDEHVLVPPFSWFTTRDFSFVEEERRHRINSASEKLSRFLFTEFNPAAFEGVRILNTDEETRTDDEIAAAEEEYQHFVEGIRALRKKYENTMDSFPKYFSSVQTAQLLEHFGWNVRLATTAFSRDPKTVLADAKIIIKRISQRMHNADQSNSDQDNTCPICFDAFAPDDPEWFQLKECKHGFCRNCLSGYISIASESRSGLRVICPDSKCKLLISEKNLKALVTNDAVYQQMVDSENENFVSAAKDFKFCPRRGCDGIVMRAVGQYKMGEHFEEESVQCLPGVCTRVDGCDFYNADAKDSYEGVKDNEYFSNVEKQPLKAHRFCFSCGKAPHWPARCEDMELWREKVVQETGAVANEGDGSFEELAQNLWLKANTQPCPKCKAPIEKNDGCNHMTCTNRRCRHEFCWICRQDWRLHGRRTGGYFRCNKWTPENDEESKTNSNGRQNRLHPELQGTSQQNARQTRKNAKAMARFLHHYSRFNAHKESSDLERNMSLCVCERLKPVIQVAKEDGMVSATNDEWNGLSFIHDAFCELLECRSLLQHSYVFAFRRYRHSSNVNFSIRARTEKMGFEVLQSELEMVTEHLSDIVGRSHIRATRNQIRFLTAAAADKRVDVYHFVLKALRDDGAVRERIKKRNAEAANRVAQEEFQAQQQQEQQLIAQEQRERDRQSQIMDVLSRIQESNETNEALRQSMVSSGLEMNSNFNYEEVEAESSSNANGVLEEDHQMEMEELQQFEEIDQAILERAIRESIMMRDRETHSQHTASDGVPDLGGLHYSNRGDDVALQSSNGAFSEENDAHNFAVEVVPEELYPNVSASEAGYSSGQDYDRNTSVLTVW